MSHLLPFDPVSLVGNRISPTVRALVPASLLEKHRAVPIAYQAGRGRGTLVVAMSDPQNLHAVDDLAFAAGLDVRPVLADEGEILDVLGLHPDDANVAHDEEPAAVVQPIEFSHSDEDPAAEAGWFESGFETRY